MKGRVADNIKREEALFAADEKMRKLKLAQQRQAALEEEPVTAKHSTIVSVTEGSPSKSMHNKSIGRGSS